MSHPLEQKLARLRRRVRRWLVVHGLGRLIAAVVGTVVVLGLADYVFRSEDRGIRVIATGVLLAVLGWTCYRWLYRPWTLRLDRVELARRVGRRFPELGNNLPSAVEFLTQLEDDPTAGSPALRRAVIAETTAKAERVDFAAVLDRRPVVHGVLLAVGICLVAGILFFLNTVSSQYALARLAYPLGNVTWPRKNYLQLKHRVQRVARGQPFEVEVFDLYDAKLPPRVEIHYRFDGPDGRPLEEIQPMRRTDSTMIARRENVTRPFAYRVEGGDDHSMDWIEVELIEPPAVASLSATIRPPEYTARPPSQSTGQLRLLRGSRVTIEALATKPLKSAELRFGDDRSIACRISRRSRRFTVVSGDRQGFMPEQSGSYWFELVDHQGIHGGRDDRWEIRLIDDQPPGVNIDRPSGTTFVTPEATVPIRVTAKDDLALRRIELVVGHSEDDGLGATGVPPVSTDRRHGQDARGTREITLYEGPPRAASAADASPGQQRTIDYRWNLGDLRLQPGQRLTFHASAEDYLPQLGKSDSRAVVVVRPEQLIDRLAGRQQSILNELARALNLEQESRRQLGRIRSRLADSPRLDQVGIDRLRAAELGQREVNRILTSTTDGVPRQVQRLLADLRNNRLDSPDVRRRMEALLAELDRLGQQVLPKIAHELTAAIKTAQTRLETRSEKPPPEDEHRSQAALQTALALACEGQDEVVASLERLSGRLRRWNDYRRFHRRWAELLRRQQSLAERTGELGRDMLGKMPEDIAPETAARLKMIADDQFELARCLDQLLQEMDQSRAALADRDPLAAETIADAVAGARRLGISARMHTAGNSVARNRLGRAGTLQAGIIADLQEILDVLSNRRQDELARLARRLPEVEGQLTELIQRQANLREQMHKEAHSTGEAQQQWASLGRQQQQLQSDTQRLSRRLTQLLAEAPARWTQTAAGQMGLSARAAARRDAQAAEGHAAKAEKALGEAARRLAEQMRQIRTEAATEQLARLEETVKSFHRRQREAAEQTRRLAQTVHAAAARTEIQIATLRRLAHEQRGLQEETSTLAAGLSSAAVLRRVLDEAAEQMAVAAGWLARQNTDRRVQTAQEAALDRLARLVEALGPTSPGPEEAGPGGAQGPAPPGQAKAPSDPKVVAQLRLLRLLQEDLFVRTQQWEKRFGQLAPLPPEARRQYKQLSSEQGELADLLFALIGSDEADRPAPRPGPADQN